MYRINPSNDKELQRCPIGANSWSRVCDFNGYHILDLLLSSNGKDIEVYTDRYAIYEITAVESAKNNINLKQKYYD